MEMKLIFKRRKAEKYGFTENTGVLLVIIQFLGIQVKYQ